MPLTVGDRLELHELAARYANTIDERDWDRFETVFTADCHYELRNFGRLNMTLVGAPAVRTHMERSQDHPVAHHVTNVEVLDGDPVRMLSKIAGTLPGGGVGSADYADVVVSTPRGWRISTRIVTLRRPAKAVPQ
jgi:hypothetical protein